LADFVRKGKISCVQLKWKPEILSVIKISGNDTEVEEKIILEK